jgi:hypothetical protein
MLVDTSVLIPTLQPHHSLYAVADRAIRLLPWRGRNLHVVAQNLIELWVVATRPLGENGLGMTPAEAAADLGRIKAMFSCSCRRRRLSILRGLWCCNTQFRESLLTMRVWSLRCRYMA